MRKEELINLFMAFVENRFPELIEGEKDGFSYGDRYYYIFTNGEVIGDYWRDRQIDKERLSIGNAFKTEEEAEFAAEKLKVIHELESLGRHFKSDRENHFIYLDGEKLKVHLNLYCQTYFIDCYFDSKEEVHQAIGKIGEGRIKRYLFGVEE